MRALEVLEPGCTRVWIEERTYSFRPIDADTIVGSYGNFVISHPVGISPTKECHYALPASQPISSQARLWNVVGRRQGDSHWRLEVTPGLKIHAPGIGLTSEAFETDLDVLDGDAVIDRAPMLGPNGMRFSRKRPMPENLLAGVHALLTALNSGECTRMLSKMVPDAHPHKQEQVSEVCDLQRRIRLSLGEYQSVRLIDVVSLDGYRLPDRLYQVRESYFATIEAQYAEGQLIPSHMLLERSDKGAFESVVIW